MSGLFADDPDLHLAAYVCMEFYVHRINAERLDWLFKFNQPLVERDAFFQYRVGYHLGCHGAEESFVFADFHFECNREFLQLCRNSLGVMQIFLLPAGKLLLFFLESLEIAGSRPEPDLSGDKIISGVAVLNGDNIAQLAEFIMILTQND